MPSAISFLWELPLAVASRSAFYIVRFVLRRLARLHYRRARCDATSWRVLNDQLLQRRLALSVVMTEGPRWNTHAVIARAGPLSVRNCMQVQVAEAQASAASWTLVVYSFPGHRTIAVLGPEDAHASKQSAAISLPPGRYSLIVRYYQPNCTATLPAVSVDGDETVASGAVPEGTNDFYQHLSNRRTWFHVVLHYHAFIALKYRNWLPRRLVERVFLPVGNPETLFHYGALQPQDALQIEIADRVLDQWDAYITVYDLASFPLDWRRIASTDFQLDPFGCRCTFLVRLHRKSIGAPAPAEGDIRIAVGAAGR